MYTMCRICSRTALIKLLKYIFGPINATCNVCSQWRRYPLNPIQFRIWLSHIYYQYDESSHITVCSGRTLFHELLRNYSNCYESTCDISLINIIRNTLNCFTEKSSAAVKGDGPSLMGSIFHAPSIQVFHRASARQGRHGRHREGGKCPNSAISKIFLKE